MNTKAVKISILIFISILAWRCEAVVNCKNAGRFAEPSDSLCKNYTLCVYDASNSKYIGYQYTCPTTSVFNPNTQKCTAPSNYKCGETPTTTDVPTTTETTEATTVTEPATTTNAPSDPDCSSAGRFPVTSDTTCQKYILCVYDSSKSSYTSYEYTCPTTSVFNPNTAKCTAPANYECKSQEPTTTPTTEAPVTCTVDDFIPDPSSSDCTGYLSCAIGSDPVSETCPIGLFNPDTTECDTNYVCPA